MLNANTQELTQAEIEKLFASNAGGKGSGNAAIAAPPYDFRRSDRIAKDQVRSIMSVHENFARSIASSLSGYLRSFVASNLISVEQVSYVEIAKAVTIPGTLLGVKMRPNEGMALIEISHSLVFPIIEILLGGTGKSSQTIERETTEIERSILDGVLRLLLRDLGAAWQTISEIEFSLTGYLSGPEIFQFLPPNEAMLAIMVDVKLGEHSGTLNLSIPSIIFKMLRQKTSTTVTGRMIQSGEAEQRRNLHLIRKAEIQADARLTGPKMLLRDLLNIEAGDVIVLDYPLNREIDLHLNESRKFTGHIIATNNKRSFQVKQPAELHV